jgi:hypothetical protein
VALAWAAVGYDFYDRRFSGTGTPELPGLTYGYDNPSSNYFMDVDTKELEQYGDNNRLLLVVRVVYADVDRMTDKVLSKSGLYSIDGQKIRLVAPDSPLRSRLRVGHNAYEHSLVLLPPNILPENITDLADVKTVSGKILATKYSGSEVLAVQRK